MIACAPGALVAALFVRWLGIVDTTDNIVECGWMAAMMARYAV